MKRKIKILHLIAPTRFGGAERVLLSLADMIHKEQFCLVVGSFVNNHFANNKFVKELERMEIPNTVLWLKRAIDIQNIFRVARFIRKNRVDIIHTHGYRSDIVGLIAAKMTMRPIVSTIHGWVPISPKLRMYQQCDRMALRFFNWLIPVSDEIKEELIKAGIDPKKITRLHNAVNTEIKKGISISTTPEIPFKKSSDFFIGAIGRLSPEKNIPTFLNAAALLAEKYHHLKFMVVGVGPEKNQLRTIAKDLGLTDKLTFTGFTKEIDNIYQLLDLLVISSSTEGIPLVALEAMKYSIPVVSTRVGGIKEIIEGGVDGILVDPNNPEQLASAIEGLITDNDKYKQIAHNARKKIVERFNQSIWIKEIENIYENLIHYQEGRPGACKG